jgi:hypothetical protein
VVAEMAAREVGRLTLGEALALTALVAQKDPARRSRVALAAPAAPGLVAGVR